MGRQLGADGDVATRGSAEVLQPREVDPELAPSAAHARRRALRASTFHWFLVLACVAGALTLVPLWVPLLLASWLAMVVRPLHVRLMRRVKGSGRAAAVVTVLVVLSTLAPVALLSASLFSATASFLEQLRSSGGGREALQTLLAPEAGPRVSFGVQQLQLDTKEVMSFAQRHGGGALAALGKLFGAATTAAVAVFVFVYGFYVFLVDSRKLHQWIMNHSPLERWQTLRLSNAYAETGRGLIIGVGLTALLQGVAATIGYLIIGVPQALVLGLLTAFAALIPSVGTALVWVPLGVGLAIGGRTGEAIAVVVLGCVVAVVDNIVRPVLSRHAHLDLPTFLLFIAMLGGIAMFGAWGLLLGPLFVRLGVEALRIGRARHELGETSHPRDDGTQDAI